MPSSWAGRRKRARAGDAGAQVGAGAADGPAGSESRTRKRDIRTETTLARRRVGLMPTETRAAAARPDPRRGAVPRLPAQPGLPGYPDARRRRLALAVAAACNLVSAMTTSMDTMSICCRRGMRWHARSEALSCRPRQDARPPVGRADRAFTIKALRTADAPRRSEPDGCRSDRNQGRAGSAARRALFSEPKPVGRSRPQPPRAAPCGQSPIENSSIAARGSHPAAQPTV